MKEQVKAELKTQMNSNDTRTRSIQTCVTADNHRPITCVALIARLRRHVNPRTLAFVMFVAFALLHTMHGRDAQTEQAAARVEDSTAARYETLQAERVYDLKAPPKKFGNKSESSR